RGCAVCSPFTPNAHAAFHSNRLSVSINSRLAMRKYIAAWILCKKEGHQNGRPGTKVTDEL
ncbi:MAG: hypothetical protein AAFN70_01940, partial [Planctomycetota bacterium]